MRLPSDHFGQNPLYMCLDVSAFNHKRVSHIWQYADRCGKMPQNETLNSRLCYYASVMFVDEQIGLIYETLRKLDLLESTYIIFTGQSSSL